MNRFKQFLNERRILDFVEHLTTLDGDELDTVLESIDNHSLQMVLATLNESSAARRADTRSRVQSGLLKRFTPRIGKTLLSPVAHAETQAQDKYDYTSPRLRGILRGIYLTDPQASADANARRSELVANRRARARKEREQRAAGGVPETRTSANKEELRSNLMKLRSARVAEMLFGKQNGV
jgi:hypothetical protein